MHIKHKILRGRKGMMAWHHRTHRRAFPSFSFSSCFFELKTWIIQKHKWAHQKKKKTQRKPNLVSQVLGEGCPPQSLSKAENLKIIITTLFNQAKSTGKTKLSLTCAFTSKDCVGSVDLHPYHAILRCANSLTALISD